MVQLTDYTMICCISSLARFCLALGLVTTSNVCASESVCGVRQVLRTIVDNSPISVAKEWAAMMDGANPQIDRFECTERALDLGQGFVVAHSIGAIQARGGHRGANDVDAV